MSLQANLSSPSQSLQDTNLLLSSIIMSNLLTPRHYYGIYLSFFFPPSEGKDIHVPQNIFSKMVESNRRQSIAVPVTEGLMVQTTTAPCCQLPLL